MKKVLSFILCAAMILSLGAFNISAAWDGTTASASLAGDGTQDSPYLVETAEDLAFLAKSVNEGNTYEGKYIVQTADIDLGGKEWTPIGFQKINGAEVDAPFSGVYSGLGHKVTGLSITNVPTNHTGLFGYVMSGEVEAGIANLTVEGAIVIDGVASNNIGIGGVAGSVGKDTSAFKANVVLANCTSDVSVTLTNCTAEPRVGGLTGYVFYGKVENCVSNGNVSVVASNQTRVAGLVGQTNRTHFINCVSNGAVYGEVTVGAKAGRVAGIASVITRGGSKGDEATATYTIFENCINNGAITGKGMQNVWVAGIGADFYVNNGTWPGKDMCVKFINCINNGAIYSETNNTANFPHAGGIAGYTQNGYTGYEFIGCINNNAEISSVGGKEVRAGGIVGSVYAKAAEYKFDQCISVGELKSSCFSIANKDTALATSIANADVGTVIVAIQAVEALLKESTVAIAGFDPAKGTPEPEVTEPEVTEPETTPAPETTEPAPETTAPSESEPTGDSALIFVVIALISLAGVAVIAKRREN